MKIESFPSACVFGLGAGRPPETGVVPRCKAPRLVRRILLLHLCKLTDPTLSRTNCRPFPGTPDQAAGSRSTSTRTWVSVAPFQPQPRLQVLLVSVVFPDCRLWSGVPNVRFRYVVPLVGSPADPSSHTLGRLRGLKPGNASETLLGTTMKAPAVRTPRLNGCCGGNVALARHRVLGGVPLASDGTCPGQTPG